MNAKFLVAAQASVYLTSGCVTRTTMPLAIGVLRAAATASRMACRYQKHSQAVFNQTNKLCSRLRMCFLEFVPSSPGGTVFDVVSNGSMIGMVWSKGDRWHASIVSRSDTSICELSREQAAQQLLKRWIEVVQG